MSNEEPQGTAARRAALRMLDAVLRRDQTLDQAMTQSVKGLPREDALFAQAIAGETLRRLPDLDALIDERTELPDDSKARMVLRLALAQRIALGTPDHATVSTALPLVARGPRRLVHGVLSRLLKQDLPTLDEPLLPPAVENRWHEIYGDDMIAAASRQIAFRPPLDLSFKADPGEFAGEQLAPLHRRLVDAGDVTKLDGFDEGRWWVQDLASSLPARLLGGPPANILDACAAPGGKTMQLAAAGHRVTALDRSESRLKRLSENLARVGLEASVIAERLEDHKSPPYDAVLLDAPCSATGTFRRHPEVLYRARPQIVADLAQVQARLLNHAGRLVRPGGRLVYAVCSLEPEEGEARIADFLAQNPRFSVDPVGDVIPGIRATKEGWLRIVPGDLEEQGGLDGFFTARLVAEG